MELPENFKLYLMTSPQQTAKARQHGLAPAHLAYRVGAGPHLFRVQTPVGAQGGIMVLGCDSPEGKENPEAFCQEVVRECAARGFQGAFFDFEGQAVPVLQKAVNYLGPVFQRRGWSLYVPESYLSTCPGVKVVISTALSGGSLQQRLSQVAQAHGPERVVLGLEWAAEDFTLPAPEGGGTHLSQAELDELLEKRAPAVYFDHELCAHYFTYMHTGQNAHFVLYDNPSSMVKKLHIAASLGIREGFLPLPEREEYLQVLLGR